jgi:hypothetical protein
VVPGYLLPWTPNELGHGYYAMIILKSRILDILLISWAGTCKDLIQEYYSYSKKNPGMEPAPIGESSAPKRRRTTLVIYWILGASLC